MSSEWRQLTFGGFLGIQRGHDLPDQSRRSGNVPILGSFGITGFHDTVKVKGPGVTIGRSGASFGVAAYTEKDYWPLNTALYVTDFKGNDPKFVFYFLKQFDFSAFNSGSAQPSLNRNNLYPVSICVPFPDEQKLISQFLCALDDRIALLRETNATLEAIAQALFKSWFVDFDPVRAKQQGRNPEGVDSATAALFPDSFEESELGLVPSGWKLKSIGDISEILNGYAFKSEDYVEQESSIFVLRTTNFSDDGYAKRLTKDVFLSISFLKSHSKYLCEPFDFHLVMVGASVGTTSTLLPHMLPALRNQNMWCFRPRNGFPSKFFIHEIVKLKVVEALRSTSGSAR